MKFITSLAILGFISCFGFLGPVAAQVGSVTLSGRVFDPNSASVVEATVEARNIDTGVSTIVETNTLGIYTLTGLSAGRYAISVSKKGFKEIVKSNLEFHTADRLSLNFTMDVGSVKETVTVSAEAEQLPTDNPAVGLLVNRDFVENTPLNGRSFQDLIALAPGAVSSSNGNGLYSINGQRDDGNYFVVDGVAANVNASPAGINGGDLRGLAGALPAETAVGTTQALTSLDALQEFKIQTSGYSAEYGRQPGGQVELTTRSGTDAVHGSLFDYFRNDALDANDWFFDQQKIPKQEERQNDFGGTLGGAPVIPKIYNGKDKTFYFISYEGLRLKEPVFTGIQAVPSLPFRSFASSTIQPFLNSTPIPNGPDDGDQCATSVGQTFSCTAQWSAAYSQPSSVDAFSVRIDESIGQRLQLFGRFSDTPSSTSFQNESELRKIINNTRSWTIGSSIRISPHWLNEFRVNYTTTRAQTHIAPDFFSGGVPYPRSLIAPTQYTQGVLGWPHPHRISYPMRISSISLPTRIRLVSRHSSTSLTASQQPWRHIA